jgi:hypothetical protein
VHDPAVEFARAGDRRVLIRVAPSGGRTDVERLAAELAGDPDRRPGARRPAGEPDGPIGILQESSVARMFQRRLLVADLAHWFAHRVLFRGGWTVQVDAPDRDPLRVRCRSRAQAVEYAGRLRARLDAEGERALDGLARRYRP